MARFAELTGIHLFWSMGVLDVDNYNCCVLQQNTREEIPMESFAFDHDTKPIDHPDR